MLIEASPSLQERACASLDEALARLPAHAGFDPTARIAAFLGAFAVPAPFGGFKQLPDAARGVHAQVLAMLGEEGERAFLLACMFGAVRDTLAGARFAGLPARVRGHQSRHFERILRHDAAFLPHCALDSDLFLKDFGLATLRLYAGGSNLIDHRSGVPRSLLWRGGPARLPARAWLFARTGGFRPFFEIHAHKLYMDEFNEEGRNECYRCCVDLYEVHPEVLGMYAGSWFYDAAVAPISPRLAYLREVPERGGAIFLFDSYSEQAVRNATATSPTRKALWEAGKYKPANHALIWPRARQQAWARQAGQAMNGAGVK